MLQSVCTVTVERSWTRQDKTHHIEIKKTIYVFFLFFDQKIFLKEILRLVDFDEIDKNLQKLFNCTQNPQKHYNETFYVSISLFIQNVIC